MFDATAEPGYVWHCHILEHEDNEMMRPLKIMPAAFAKDSDIGDYSLIPESFELGQNYPNPFNANTNINFDIASAGNTDLRVYNLAGQVVETLLDGYLEAGSHSVNWDASKVSSGVYFYKLKSGDNVAIRKMNLVK
jgi:hypothetical protein